MGIYRDFPGQFISRSLFLHIPGDFAAAKMVGLDLWLQMAYVSEVEHNLCDFDFGLPGESGVFYPIGRQLYVSCTFPVTLGAHSAPLGDVRQLLYTPADSSAQFL